MHSNIILPKDDIPFRVKLSYLVYLVYIYIAIILILLCRNFGLYKYYRSKYFKFGNRD